jgi:hypothetical protein
MSHAPAQRTQRAIGIVQIVILVLVAITAFVHLQRGIGMSLFGFGGPRGGGFPAAGAAGGAGGGGGRFPGGGPGGFGLMRMLPLPLPILFLLNGAAYLVLGGALYLPALARYQSVVRWLLIALAATTFVLYFLLMGFRLNPLAILDKLAELALIVLLLIDARQSSTSAAAKPSPA